MLTQQNLGRISYQTLMKRRRCITEPKYNLLKKGAESAKFWQGIDV